MDHPPYIVARWNEDGRHHVEIQTGPPGNRAHIVTVSISPTGKYAKVIVDGKQVAGR
jgi:hypothetical protein